MSARPLFAFILPPPLALQLAALCLVLCLCCFLAPLKLRRATAPSKPCPVLSCLPCGACARVCVCAAASAGGAVRGAAGGVPAPGPCCGNRERR